LKNYVQNIGKILLFLKVLTYILTYLEKQVLNKLAGKRQSFGQSTFKLGQRAQEKEKIYLSHVEKEDGCWYYIIIVRILRRSQGGFKGDRRELSRTNFLH